QPEDDPYQLVRRITPSTVWESCPEEDTYPVPAVTFTALFNELGNYVVSKRLRLAEGIIDTLLSYATQGTLPNLETLLLDAGNSITETHNPCTCEGRCGMYVEEQMRRYVETPGGLSAEDQRE